ADDLAELPGADRDRATLADLRRHRHARPHLEVGGRHADRFGLRLEQDVGQDRQGLPRLHDVVDHLQALEELITVEDDFHDVLPFSERGNRKASSRTSRRSVWTRGGGEKRWLGGSFGPPGLVDKTVDGGGGGVDQNWIPWISESIVLRSLGSSCNKWWIFSTACRTVVWSLPPN